jgi:hypothetical protein
LVHAAGGREVGIVAAVAVTGAVVSRGDDDDAERSLGLAGLTERADSVSSVNQQNK